MENKQNLISKPANAVLNFAFIIYSLLCIIPLFLVLAVSFSDEISIAKDGYKFIPEKFSTAAYHYLFLNSKAIITAYGVTIFATVVGSVLSIVVIALYAYPLSRKDFKYRNLFTFIVFFTMLFSGGLVPWYLVCTRILHIQDTIWALIIPYLMNGWYVLIMRTFFSTTIPDSIIEAAKIDGAGEFRIFAVIVIPLAKPVIATIALFNTIFYWNDWWLPLMLLKTKDNLANLQFTMYKITTNIQYLTQIAPNAAAQSGNTVAMMPSETARMAMCVLAVGPIIIAYPFFQKYFVKGLTIGGVKG
jgi:putative aldouronate transport system permease protein